MLEASGCDYHSQFDKILEVVIDNKKLWSLPYDI